MSSNTGLRIIIWEWAKDIENTPLEKKSVCTNMELKEILADIKF